MDEKLEILLKKENNQNGNLHSINDSQTQDIETKVMKECLFNIKFKYPFEDEWYKKASFELKDATKYKAYTNKDNRHFTHIYSYNKLMSKECRSKIAHVLNHSNYKVLAWYNNPKQTKKSGLKNFTFLCKFPMQSTSTEKFHVYVYIKTKTVKDN